MSLTLTLLSNNTRTNKLTKKKRADLVNEILELHDSIVTMTALEAKHPGKTITFGEGDEMKSINPKKDLPEAEKTFKKSVQILANCKLVKEDPNEEGQDEKPKKNGLMESFIKLTGPMKAFLEKADFGPIDPLKKGSKNLIDELPLAKSGYMSRLTFTYLFNIYCKHHGLQHETYRKLIVPDATLNKAVNVDAASYLPGEDGELKKNDGKTTTMAIIRKIEKAKYKALKEANDKAKKETKPLQHFQSGKDKPTIQNPINVQSILRYNSVSPASSEEFKAYLEKNKDALLAEVEIAKKAKAQYDDEKYVPKYDNTKLENA